MLLMAKSTISMAIFNSYVSLPVGKHHIMMIKTWVNPWNMGTFQNIEHGCWTNQMGINKNVGVSENWLNP